jgi:hypothetical protein
MNNKRDRSVKKNWKVEEELRSQDETRESAPSEIAERVQRMRRTFHCSVTKPGGCRERWLVM